MSPARSALSFQGRLERSALRRAADLGSLFASLLVLFGPSPARAADAPTVSLIIHGTNAPAFAAETIAALVKSSRDDLIDQSRISDSIKSVPGRCGLQPEALSGTGSAAPVRRGCYGWDAIIGAGTWPEAVPQVKSLKDALKVPGRTDSYYLPRVKTFVLTSVATQFTEAGQARLAADEPQSLCRQFRWSNADASNCVVGVLPRADSRTQLASKREIVVRHRVLRVSFEVVPERQDVFRSRAASVIAAVAKKYPQTSAVFEEPPRRVEALFAQATPAPAAIALAPACPAAQLRAAASRARASISWPGERPDDPLPPTSLTILEINEKAIGDRQLWVPSDAIRAPKYPSQLEQVVEHPMLRSTPAWTPNCGIFSPTSDDVTFSHSVAVASIIEGQKIKVATGQGAPFELAPFFPPGTYTLLGISGIHPGISPGLSTPAVLVASYQEAAPKPQVRPSAPEPEVKDYVAYADALLQGGNIIVAAAPKGDPGLVVDSEFNPFGDFACDYWPSCLGSLGWVITVAALKPDGSLLTADPVDQRPYEISQRTVEVAAGGGELPVATMSGHGPALSLQSGTSLAAPVVAALALEMMRKWSTSLQAYDVVAAIQSTADLTRDFSGRLRFGVVDARRALQLVETDPGTVRVYPASSDEAKDARSPGKSVRFAGIDKGSDCGVAEQDTAMGVLQYTRPHDPVVSDNGTIAPPACIPMKDVLRLRWTSTDINGGVPLFTLVHWAGNFHGGRKYAYIERDIALAPDASCAIDGIDGGPAHPPCISTVGDNGTKSGINLIGADLVFNPRNRLSLKP